jgi:ferredoxin
MPMKISINAERCQGHGRCYDLAPDIFGEDEEGYGVVLGNGIVDAAGQAQARLAVLNCPESAIEVEGDRDDG